MKRYAMSTSQNRRNFKAGNRVHPSNGLVTPMRGGIRK